MTTYDLTTSSGRYYARRAGLDVPKRKAGGKPINFDSCVSMMDGCLVWTGPVNRDGYGRFRMDNRRWLAHRYSYEREFGPLLNGTVLRHTCDNPACCLPAHLIPGTHRDNQLDKFAKGRQAKGERNGSSKLKEPDVRSIRDKYAQGGWRQSDLATAFGVSLDLVHKIVSRKLWTHV